MHACCHRKIEKNTEFLHCSMFRVSLNSYNHKTMPLGLVFFALFVNYNTFISHRICTV